MKHLGLPILRGDWVVWLLCNLNWASGCPLRALWDPADKHKSASSVRMLDPSLHILLVQQGCKGQIVETWEEVMLASAFIVYIMRQQRLRLTATAGKRSALKDSAGRDASGQRRVSLMVQTSRGPSGSPKWYFAGRWNRGFSAATGNMVPTPYVCSTGTARQTFVLMVQTSISPWLLLCLILQHKFKKNEKIALLEANQRVFVGQLPKLPSLGISKGHAGNLTGSSFRHQTWCT